MADSGFDYTEFKNYVENLTKASDKKDFETFLKQFLLEMAQRVVKQAKPKTPVDTGALRNSYVIGNAERFLKKTGGTSKSGKAKVTRDLSKSTVEDIKIVGDIVEVTIGNDMEYASFIEWGSSTKDGKWKKRSFYANYFDRRDTKADSKTI